MKSARLQGIPDDLRQAIKSRRKELGWSQHELAQQAGLAQRHMSGIETGKIVPRYDTLLEILRVLGRDLCVIPRELVPVVQALVRDYGDRDTDSGIAERGAADRTAGSSVSSNAADAGRPPEERPLYAVDESGRDD